MDHLYYLKRTKINVQEAGDGPLKCMYHAAIKLTFLNKAGTSFIGKTLIKPKVKTQNYNSNQFHCITLNTQFH